MTARLTTCWMVAVFLAGPVLAQSSELEQAYQRELAFLTTEMKALERQKDELAKQYQDQVGEARRELEELRLKVERLELQSEELDRELRTMESGREAAMERADVLDNTLHQGSSTLAERGIDIGTDGAEDEDDDPAAQLDRIFVAAAKQMELGGRLRVSPGSFFLADGTRADGQVYRLGEIAAFGVSSAGSGALVPFDGQRLRVSNHDLAASAEALESGTPKSVLGLVLLDRQGGAADERKDRSVSEFISAGGVIGWIIVALGIVGVGMGIFRILLLLRERTDVDGLLARLGPLVSEGKLEAAAAQAMGEKGSAARVIAAVIPALDTDAEKVENTAGEAILRQLPALERFGAALTVIAAVAPLLGLLGTVTGMISTFDVITEFGTGDPKMLSGGISEALVTTELGLIVAIPVLMFANLLGAWSQRMVADMEKAVMHLANTFGTPPGLEGDSSDQAA
jgi:biopolymer transport protein ExbB